MRQVPYGIIGNGRVATHFCHYLQLLKIPYQQWHRTASLAELQQLAQNCQRILLLISDCAIENFINEHIFLKQKMLLHFSGNLTTSHAYSAHPLKSFASQSYDLDTYLKIPFIIEQEGPEFQDLLPELKNPHYKIPRDYKNLYHALCVLSGNFTSILWQKLFMELEQQFQIPRTVAYPYLESIMENLKINAEAALTGPLVRNDQITINANINALANDPFKIIYQAFVAIYQQGNIQ